MSAKKTLPPKRLFKGKRVLARGAASALLAAALFLPFKKVGENRYWNKTLPSVPERVEIERGALGKRITEPVYERAQQSKSTEIDQAIDQAIRKRIKMEKDFNERRSSVIVVDGERIAYDPENAELAYEQIARNPELFEKFFQMKRESSVGDAMADALNVLDHAGPTIFYERLQQLENWIKQYGLPTELEEIKKIVEEHHEKRAAYFARRSNALQQLIDFPEAARTSSERLAREIREQASRKGKKVAWMGSASILGLWAAAELYGLLAARIKRRRSVNKR